MGEVAFWGGFLSSIVHFARGGRRAWLESGVLIRKMGGTRGESPGAEGAIECGCRVR